MPIKFFARENKTVEILIYEQIGKDFWGEGVTAVSFQQQLNQHRDAETLDIRVNSPGGSVFEGVTIYNLLKAHSAQKNVYVDGIAASIASTIAMAGDKIIMGEGTFFMVHEPWTFVGGNRFDFLQAASRLETISNEMAAIYERRTGLELSKILEIMKAETYLNTEESLELGFADEISGEPLALSASAFDLPWMKKAPDAVKGLSSLKAQNDDPVLTPPGEDSELKLRSKAIADKARSITNNYLQLKAEYLTKE